MKCTERQYLPPRSKFWSVSLYGQPFPRYCNIIIPHRVQLQMQKIGSAPNKNLRMISNTYLSNVLYIH